MQTWILQHINDIPCPVGTIPWRGLLSVWHCRNEINFSYNLLHIKADLKVFLYSIKLAYIIYTFVNWIFKRRSYMFWFRGEMLLNFTLTGNTKIPAKLIRNKLFAGWFTWKMNLSLLGLGHAFQWWWWWVWGFDGLNEDASSI